MAFIQVILSGGLGSRLWPLSRKSQPKQYIPMFAGKTLFQWCALRNRDLCDLQLVVGNRDNHQLTQRDMEALGYNNFVSIIEAEPRNTAAAIAFAAFSLDKEDIMLVTPSDHMITDQKGYEMAIDRAYLLARNNHLVTFGIKPRKADTGYGYIEFDGEDVLSFIEKPDEARARELVRSGRFLCNSGMFCFKAGIYLEELEQFQPGLFHAAQRAWRHKELQYLPQKESRLIPAMSIDVAVMERSEKIKVVPGSFGWNDLGSFEAIWDYKQDSDDGQSITGANLALGTRKHVEFIGMEDVILVETEDAILVLPKHKSQDVKLVYERLEKEKPELLL